MHKVWHMPPLRTRAGSSRAKTCEEIHQIQPPAVEVAENANGRGIHRVRNFNASKEPCQCRRSAQARWQAIGFREPDLLEVCPRFRPVTTPAGIHRECGTGIIIANACGTPRDIIKRIHQFDRYECPLVCIREIASLKRTSQSRGTRLIRR